MADGHPIRLSHRDDGALGGLPADEDLVRISGGMKDGCLVGGRDVVSQPCLQGGRQMGFEKAAVGTHSVRSSPPRVISQSLEQAALAALREDLHALPSSRSHTAQLFAALLGERFRRR